MDRSCVVFVTDIHRSCPAQDQSKRRACLRKIPFRITHSSFTSGRKDTLKSHKNLFLPVYSSRREDAIVRSSVAFIEMQGRDFPDQIQEDRFHALVSPASLDIIQIGAVQEMAHQPV